MFEVGDKVKCVNTEYSNDRLLFGQTYIINDIDGYVKLTDTLGWWSPGRFELVEEKPQFDLKKNPWFIRTGTKEKSEAAQKWLFEQGIGWAFIGKIVRGYNEKYLTNTDIDGSINTGGLLHGNTNPSESAQEIILEFETVVKSVKYPEVMTEQDKKIQELKETIEKAQQQIKELQGINS